MALLSSYRVESFITDTDRLLGANENSETSLFTVGSLRTYFSNTIRSPVITTNNPSTYSVSVVAHGSASKGQAGLFFIDHLGTLKAAAVNNASDLIENPNLTAESPLNNLEIDFTEVTWDASSLGSQKTGRQDLYVLTGKTQLDSRATTGSYVMNSSSVHPASSSIWIYSSNDPTIKAQIDYVMLADSQSSFTTAGNVRTRARTIQLKSMSPAFNTKNITAFVWGRPVGTRDGYRGTPYSVSGSGSQFYSYTTLNNVNSSGLMTFNPVTNPLAGSPNSYARNFVFINSAFTARFYQDGHPMVISTVDPSTLTNATGYQTSSTHKLFKNVFADDGCLDLDQGIPPQTRTYSQTQQILDGVWHSRIRGIFLTPTRFVLVVLSSSSRKRSFTTSQDSSMSNEYFPSGFNAYALNTTIDNNQTHIMIYDKNAQTNAWSRTTVTTNSLQNVNRTSGTVTDFYPYVINDVFRIKENRIGVLYASGNTNTLAVFNITSQNDTVPEIFSSSTHYANYSLSSITTYAVSAEVKSVSDLQTDLVIPAFTNYPVLRLTQAAFKSTTFKINSLSSQTAVPISGASSFGSFRFSYNSRARLDQAAGLLSIVDNLIYYYQQGLTRFNVLREDFSGVYNSTFLDYEGFLFGDRIDPDNNKKIRALPTTLNRAYVSNGNKFQFSGIVTQFYNYIYNNYSTSTSNSIAGSVPNGIIFEMTYDSDELNTWQPLNGLMTRISINQIQAYGSSGYGNVRSMILFKDMPSLFYMMTIKSNPVINFRDHLATKTGNIYGSANQPRFIPVKRLILKDFGISSNLTIHRLLSDWDGFFTENVTDGTRTQFALKGSIAFNLWENLVPGQSYGISSSDGSLFQRGSFGYAINNQVLVKF